MKALIRNESETVTEAMGIPGIDWNTGMPLTNPEWAGGAYALVEDYIPPTYDENGEVITESAKSTEIVELKARLAALENGL